MDPPIHHALPHRQPDVDKASYHMMLRCIRGRLGALLAGCTSLRCCRCSRLVTAKANCQRGGEPPLRSGILCQTIRWRM